MVKNIKNICFLSALIIFSTSMSQGVFAQSVIDENVIRIQLKPTNEARINAPMTGKISRVYFKDGQSVKKGQKLVSFNCSEYNAGLAQSQARINKQSKLLDSTKQLYELGSASQTELSVLKAELAEARAARDFSNSKVRKCRITAPFSGKITAVHVKDHFSIQESEPILEMIGHGAIEIEMIIPSKWMRWVKPDTAFAVEIDETGETYNSKIIRMGGRVDPVTQTVKAYGKITGDAKNLLVGMSGQAIFDMPDEFKSALTEIDLNDTPLDTDAVPSAEDVDLNTLYKQQPTNGSAE